MEDCIVISSDSDEDSSVFVFIPTKRPPSPDLADEDPSPDFADEDR